MNVTTSGSDIVISIGGELIFSTVPALSKNNRHVIKQNPKVVFDLSQVTSSDNTGVALLVTLASFAKSLGKEISFTNLPPQLMDLVEAVGLREILPIS